MDEEGFHYHLEIVRNYWNQRAPTWRENLQKRLDSTPLDQLWASRFGAFLSYLPTPDRSVKVLDAGCGIGQLSFMLAHAGYSVKACDLSPVMLENARNMASTLAKSNPIEFVVANLAQMPYLDNEFDLVVCNLVLDFTPSPALALRELRRVTKNGGKLLLAILGANSPVKKFYWKRFLQEVDLLAGEFENVFNGITPWEVENLLPLLGWKTLYGEASYIPSVAGDQNQFNEKIMESQPAILQQTVASTWTMVAEAIEPYLYKQN